MVSVYILGYDTRLCLRFFICVTDIQLAVLSHLDITVILWLCSFLDCGVYSSTGTPTIIYLYMASIKY
jgi:hypothetical protein